MMRSEEREGRSEGTAPPSDIRDDTPDATGPASAALSRREAIGLLAAIPLAATPVAALGAPAMERAARAAADALADEAATGAPYVPKFFTAHEWRTVRLLADLVIPRDERSGSATDAGVPEFMDVVLMEFRSGQLPMRGGLAWLDAESRRRAGATFVAATPAQRTAILDDIAWPAKARPEMSHGVAFFNRFRDLVASGFFSSRIGVADLRYQGNTFVPEWKGCPEEALRKLGVSYE
jgi:hypothetical protein